MMFSGLSWMSHRILQISAVVILPDAWRTQSWHPWVERRCGPCSEDSFITGTQSLVHSGTWSWTLCGPSLTLMGVVIHNMWHNIHVYFLYLLVLSFEVMFSALVSQTVHTVRSIHSFHVFLQIFHTLTTFRVPVSHFYDSSSKKPYVVFPGGPVVYVWLWISLQVSGFPEEQLLVALSPGLPTAAELFILPEAHTPPEHRKKSEEALVSVRIPLHLFMHSESTR